MVSLRRVAILQFLFMAQGAFAHLHFTLNPSCQALLVGREDVVLSRMRQLITGSGQVDVVTVGDLLGVQLSPGARERLIAYQYHGHRFHSSLIAILPSTADHLFRQEATTYPDLTTSRLRLTSDHMWLVSERVDPVRAPMHIVVLSARGTDYSLLHESVHLEDLDDLHRLAKKILVDDHEVLLINFQIFRAISELRAYKVLAHAFIHDSHPEEHVRSLVRAMESDFIPTLKGLTGDQLTKFLRPFQIRSLAAEDLLAYFKNQDSAPSFEDVVNELNVLRVSRK